ncbi:hypothetical protein CL656_05665 [bacterium]|nr:hypothetical protein [bacterium]|tara:strand:+ start:553 stop:1251 length:699 start_codon:yes stop_codon:yes gene_type:complete
MYYLKHDQSFLKYADLKFFNKEILDLKPSDENKYILNIIKNAPKNAIILDIGAYNGDTTIYLASNLKKIGRDDIKIICFEPNSKHCENIVKYKQSLKLNIEIVNKLISNIKQTMYMKKNEGSGTMYDTCYNVNNIKYESISLDELNIDKSKIFFTKIDVEGHEPEVLAGASNTLKNSKYIYIEVWNDEHFKSRHKFKLSGSHNKRILDEIKNINVAFKPLQKIEKNILFKIL